MYKLGEQFEFDYEKALSDPKAVIKGVKYRITILSERLIRFEYHPEGLFEDRPTERVWFRNFEVPDFSIKEDRNYLEISTKYFKLFYRKESKFTASKLNPTKNLKVDLNGSDRYWYFGHPEIRNLKAPGYAFDENKGQLSMEKGLYSVDGIVSIDDSKSNIISETGEIIPREIKGIDTYLFVYGNDFQGCLNDYFKLTGRPALIPRYALGNWWSRNVDYKDADLKKLMDEFEDKEVPLSVLLLNPDWHIRKTEEKTLNTGFTWNKDYFKSPDGMIQYLHQKGIRLGLDINPEEGIYPFEEHYKEITEYLPTDEKGIVPFRLFDSKFLDAYLKLLIHPLDNSGIDFFFLDIEDKKKQYDLFYMDHYHFYDMMRNYKRRPMVLTRNPMIAPHRYPVLYSGKTEVSWDTLKEVMRSNANASNMGVSWWSHDIGGYFKGTEDNELYIRFVQLGVFSPILKFGSEKGKYYKREPWRWSVKTYGIVKDYLQLRHRMIPYLYAEAYKYYKDGTPLITPIYYKVPEMYDDVNYRNEYYFGSQLFVAPIISKKDYVMNRSIHKFYIPEGTWYDFVTGKKFPGGKNYVSFFKDQDYPVFAKSGAILPFGLKSSNDTTPPQDMEIQIFPGKNNTYYLYEDDGISDLYKKGFYLLTSIDYNYLPSNYTVIIRALEGKRGIVPDRRNYKIRFRNTKQANDVICYVNDTQTEYTSYVDGNDFVVEVSDVSSIGQLTVNCKGKDIEIETELLLKEEFESIISDLELETEMKEKIDAILFSDLTIKKKRIEIRRLRNHGLDRKFVKLFLKLLEYANEV